MLSRTKLEENGNGDTYETQQTWNVHLYPQGFISKRPIEANANYVQSKPKLGYLKGEPGFSYKTRHGGRENNRQNKSCFLNHPARHNSSKVFPWNQAIVFCRGRIKKTSYNVILACATCLCLLRCRLSFLIGSIVRSCLPSVYIPNLIMPKRSSTAWIWQCVLGSDVACLRKKVVYAEIV